MMGRQKRNVNHCPLKSQLVQDSEGNEENGHPDPDPNKIKIVLYQGTQWSPQEHPERRNTASNQWEFHRDDTRHGQPKCTGGTQEIPGKEKWKIWENTKQINEIIGALNKHPNERQNTIKRDKLIKDENW
jgi:hypothetical protein